MPNKSEVTRLLKAIAEQGFTAQRTRKGRWIIRTADGEFVAVVSAQTTSPSGWRNMLSDLRKAGFIWPLLRR